MTKKTRARKLVGCVLALMLGAGLARDAYADVSAGSGPFLHPVIVGGVFAYFTINLSLTAYDLIKDEPLSKGAAITEIALTAPQVGLATYGVVAILASDSDQKASNVIVITVLAAWPVALMAHGIHELTSPPGHYAGARSETRRLSLAPTVLSGGQGVMPGVAAVGRF